MNSIETFDGWAIGIERFWRSQGIGLQPGVPEAYILQTANDLGIAFPPAFVALYKVINGFKGTDWTRGMFVIWPLERILDEYSTNKDSSLVCFCDFLIMSHCLGFRRDRAGIFNSMTPDLLICPTYEEAIELINLDSILVH